jgi:hypothetical protein
MMMSPNAPGNVIGRGRIGTLIEAFRVNLSTAVQKTKNVLEFCMRFGNGVNFLHSMDFSYLQHTWDASNITLQDLMGPALDHAVNQSNRRCPVCLDLVFFAEIWNSSLWASNPHELLEIVQGPDDCMQSSCCMPCMAI